MSAKILSKIREYGVFAFLAVYFVICYYLVSHFSEYSYTITPAESSPSTVTPVQNLTSAPDDSPEPEALNFPAQSSITDKKDEYIPLITDTRTVKEYHGAIGIYDCFGELLEIHETDLSILPFTDRSALTEGIMFDSEGEMRNFLESLDS